VKQIFLRISHQNRLAAGAWERGKEEASATATFSGVLAVSGVATVDYVSVEALALICGMSQKG